MKKKPVGYWPVVVVEWDDAHGTEDVRAEALNHAPVRLVVAGWLICSDEEGVSIALEYTKNDPADLRKTRFIPRKMVVSETIIG